MNEGNQMNKSSRCVKVTFSVVGTRTLEYMINGDKEYQGKIYFTFDKEKATNENTLYVGFKEDYLDLINSESTIRLTDRILKYIEKGYSEYAKESVHLFIGIADKTLQNLVQSLLYEVIMANVAKTFNVDDAALAPVQVSKNVLAIYEAEAGAYRLYATNGFTVLDEWYIPAGTRGGLVQNPNNLSGESTWVADGVKVDAVSLLENACILSTNKDETVEVTNSIVLNSILRLSEEVNGSIVNGSLMTCVNITGCGLVKAVKRTLRSYDNSVIFNTDRFLDITPDASVHGFITSPNHPFEVSTRRTSSKYYYVGIDGKYYIRDEMSNREVLNKDVYFEQLGLVPEDSKVVEDNVAKLKELVRFINIDNYVAAAVASKPVFTVNISSIDSYKHSFNTVNTFHYLKNENVLVKEYREIAALIKEMSN